MRPEGLPENDDDGGEAAPLVLSCPIRGTAEVVVVLDDATNITSHHIHETSSRTVVGFVALRGGCLCSMLQFSVLGTNVYDDGDDGDDECNQAITTTKTQTPTIATATTTPFTKT